MQALTRRAATPRGRAPGAERLQRGRSPTWSTIATLSIHELIEPPRV